MVVCTSYYCVIIRFNVETFIIVQVNRINYFLICQFPVRGIIEKFYSKQGIILSQFSSKMLRILTVMMDNISIILVFMKITPQNKLNFLFDVFDINPCSRYLKKISVIRCSFVMTMSSGKSLLINLIWCMPIFFINYQS